MPHVPANPLLTIKVVPGCYQTTNQLYAAFASPSGILLLEAPLPKVNVIECNFFFFGFTENSKLSEIDIPAASVDPEPVSP